MGVPLEEMDAVFGEGNLFKSQGTKCNIFVEERLDHESERASLMSGPQSDRLSVGSGRRPKANNPGDRGWVNRLLYRDDRNTYRPIEGNEE